jgi:hypothetical protein
VDIVLSSLEPVDTAERLPYYLKGDIRVIIPGVPVAIAAVEGREDLMLMKLRDQAIYEIKLGELEIPSSTIMAGVKNLVREIGVAKFYNAYRFNIGVVDTSQLQTIQIIGDLEDNGTGNEDSLPAG